MRRSIRERRLKQLLDLKEELSGYTDLQRILDAGLKKAIEITGMDAGAIYLIDNSGELVLSASYGFPATFLKKVEIMKLGEGVTGAAAMNGKVEFIPDISKDERIIRSAVKTYGIKTLVSIPLVGADEVYGVLNLVSLDRKSYTAREGMEFFKKIGEFIGNALNNMIIYDRVQKQVERMRVLNDITTELTMLLKTTLILDKIPEYINKLFQVKDFAIIFNRNIKIVSKMRSLKDMRTPGFKRVRLGFYRPSLGKVIFDSLSDRPVVVSDYLKDNRFPVPTFKRKIYRSPRSILGTKLVFGRNTLGIIVVGSHRIGAFVREDEQILKLFATCLSGALGNALLFQDLLTSYRRLRAAQKVIVKGEKIAALIRLTTQIAHRIKNSLGAMRTSLDVLTKNEGITNEGRELIDILSMENNKLNKLVDDFFEFAGPERRSFEKVNLPDFLNDTINSFLEEVSNEKLKLLRSPDRRIRDLRLNPVTFSSLLRRLLENAVEATAENHGEIVVGYRLVNGGSSRHKYVEFFVKDSGHGIEPAIIPKVTEPFFTTKPGGNGLGLAIVERIAEQHGGDLIIESRKDKGTCVKVLIPIR